MKKEIIGLNCWLVTFKTNEEKIDFITKNKDKYAIAERFLNNEYGLEITKPRRF